MRLTSILLIRKLKALRAFKCAKKRESFPQKPHLPTLILHPPNVL